jgi:hypothetical protein
MISCIKSFLLDQGFGASDIATFRAQFMNATTAGLSVRLFRNTISAEIRGPEDFSGKIFNAD